MCQGTDFLQVGHRDQIGWCLGRPLHSNVGALATEYKAAIRPGHDVACIATTGWHQSGRTQGFTVSHCQHWRTSALHQVVVLILQGNAEQVFALPWRARFTLRMTPGQMAHTQT